MSTSLHLATAGDIDKLLPMVAAFHGERGIVMSDAARRAALMPLLEGVPQGAIWLAGPRAAPLGYIAVGTGWSIALGGMDGFIDEFFLRPNVRGRGIGTEALSALGRLLKAQGVRALHLEAQAGAPRSLYARLGFQSGDRDRVLTCRL